MLVNYSMLRSMKALLGICLFVIIGLIVISTLSSGPPTTSTALHSLVTQTHHQLNQLHKLKEELEGEQPLDNTILPELGFVDHPLIYPNHSWYNITTPVIVTAVSWRKVHLVVDFIQVAQTISANTSLVIFCLDLSELQIKEINNICNETCEVLIFDFSRYPSHVRDLHLGAYRPIIIQEMLQRSGVVFWLDTCMQFLEQSSSSFLVGDRSLVEKWTKKSYKNGGVLAWPLLHPAPHLPTAALTHPDMFPAFRTQKTYYDFQKMSSPKAALIINTNLIHQRLMRPWVSCALTSSCLSPIGAQDTGCIYNKKPLFRYSGCHLYDTSAFNVALGLAFGIDNESYLAPDVTFGCVTDTLSSESLPSLESPSFSSKFQSVSSHGSGAKRVMGSTNVKKLKSDPKKYISTRINDRLKANSSSYSNITRYNRKSYLVVNRRNKHYAGI